ncbi:hypothetical protein S40293_04401 [Stachybotrys chartarum IBT 40293]|nr:hypothetical protein S40293_04401 [Stachybotrys chartarum IBT 40293]
MSRPSATWTRLTSSNRLQRSSHALSIVESKVFIFGGELTPRQPVDSQLDVIDLKVSANGKRCQFMSSTDPSDQPHAATVETLPAPSLVPSPRVGTASAVLNGDIYIFSGRGGIAMDAIDEGGKLWRYSPSETAWSVVELAFPDNPAPAPRSYYAMTSDGISKIYVHAGCPAQGRLSDLWAFDTHTCEWKELPPAPAPPRGGTSITFSGGKIYRMGGFDGKSEQGGSIDVYDVAKESWESIVFSAGQDGPEARSVAALLVVKVRNKDTLVTMFGERDPSALGHAGAGKMLGDVWAFDIEEKVWCKVEVEGEAPAPRGWFDADVMRSSDGDAVIVHGGLAEDNSRLGDVWKLVIV